MVNFRQELEDALHECGRRDLSALDKSLAELEVFFVGSLELGLSPEDQQVREANDIYTTILDRYNAIKSPQRVYVVS